MCVGGQDNQMVCPSDTMICNFDQTWCYPGTKKTLTSEIPTKNTLAKPNGTNGKNTIHHEKIIYIRF